VELQIGPDGRVVDRVDHMWLVNPEIPIPRKVTEITGLSDANVAGKPTFSEIVDEVTALFAGRVTIAHNYTFDLMFLEQECRRAGRPWPAPLAEVDTVDLSHRVFPDADSHKLGDLAKRLDVPLVQAHRATDDAAACGICFAEMARKASIEDDLEAMLDWAGAIGRPPEDGPFTVDELGHAIFADGEHAGQRVGLQPVYLHWMSKALVRGPHGWTHRFPESARRWAWRWLVARGSGRAEQNPKGFHRDDWVIDPCIAVE
jgi:hypothetical protein